MDYPICLTLLVLVGSALALPTDMGPQTFDAKPARTPREEPGAKRPTRQQEYKEVIMYLTPSQIRHLEETQNEHGYILPNALSDASLQSEENKALDQQLQEQLLKQNQGQGSPSLEQQLQEQLEEQEPRPSLQELEKQLVLKQEADKQLQQKLKQEQSLEQQLIKQESSQSITQQLQQQFLNEEEVRQHFEQQLIKEAGENKKQEQKLLKQVYESQQGQNRTETKEKEAKSKANQKLQQKYVVAEGQKAKYKQLAPQLQLVPEQQQNQYVPQHLLRTPQFIYLDVRPEQAQQQPLQELRQVFYPEQNLIRFLQHHRPRPSVEVENQPKYYEPAVAIEPQPAIEVQQQPQLQVIQHPVKLEPQPELLVQDNPQNLEPVQVQLHRQLRPQVEIVQPQPAIQLQLLKRPEPQLQIQLRPQPELQLRPQPELQIRPQPELQLQLHKLSEPQVEIQLRPQPQIQLHKFTEPELQLQPQLKVEHGEMKSEVRILADPPNKFELVPYQYIPEQQDEHKQIGHELFKQQFNFLGEQSKLNAESLHDSNEKLVKLKKQQDQQELLGKEILNNQIKLLQQEANRESEVLKKEIEKQNNEQVLKAVLKLNEEENIKPVHENQALLEDVPKIQELSQLDLLQKISNDQFQKESQKLKPLTHLDILRHQNELSQYAPRFNEPQFSLADIENVIKNIEKEKLKAQKTIEAINRSPPVVVNKEITLKRRPIELIKTVKVPVPTPYLYPVPQPYAVKVPQPYAVPLQIINPYIVPIVKTEKVEVEKPVPIEVEKRVPVEVEKKVYVHINKPYTVDRFVPYEVKKEIPVEVPLYRPQKFTILRHVWKN
ncbi:hypothetical protein JYU34_013660 [Plutella xylostella]|uniref:Cuticular protein n=1 Tax=Plutella xylostella TaxID=51655 RepID=A0ABQ7QAD0_PLUXY|nr:hypothetical protein JYU34_013660 [Plutella xylostella]